MNSSLGFGTALTKLMSESRKIRKIGEAEEKIIGMLWQLLSDSHPTIYIMRHIHSMHAFIVSRQIGNSTLMDVILPESLNIIEKLEEGNPVRIPEQYSPVPPFRNDRFYTIFPILDKEYTRYLIIVETGKALPQITINFTEEYLSQAKRLLEKTNYIYVNDLAHRAFQTISRYIYTDTHHIDMSLSKLPTILITKRQQLVVLSAVDDGISQSYIAGRDIESTKVNLPLPSVAQRHLESMSKRKAVLLKKWDIPDFIKTIILKANPQYAMLIDNINFGAIKVERDSWGVLYLMAIFSTEKTIPFTEADVASLRNLLQVAKMLYRIEKTQYYNEHMFSLIEKTVGSFQHLSELISNRKGDIRTIFGSIYDSVPFVIGLYIEKKDGELISLKEQSYIDITEVLSILSKRYVYHIENTDIYLYLIKEKDFNIYMIHKGEMGDGERNALSTLIKNYFAAYEYAESIDRHMDILQRAALILPVSMEKLGIEPLGSLYLMLKMGIHFARKLPEISFKDIQVAIALHDVGKLYLPLEILQKKGPLTDEEWNIVKTHVLYGSEFIGRLSALRSNVRDAILYHHENYDGSGYPYGLMGEEIPPLARVIRILDAYTAMALPTVYKEPIPPEKALEEIKKGEGREFDPNLVPILEEAIKEVPL